MFVLGAWLPILAQLPAALQHLELDLTNTKVPDALASFFLDGKEKIRVFV